MILESIKGLALLILLISAGAWLLLAAQFGPLDALSTLPDFLESVVFRLASWSALFPSLVVVVISLALLLVFATLSAWLQIHYRGPLWRRFGLVLLFPSFVPVYIYGLALESEISNSAGLWLFSGPICVALGNGLWWWWHRQFVEGLQEIRNQKALVGIANLGLDPARYFVLPEFRLYVLQRIPEMFLWVAVNVLFFEAAVPQRSGILYDLILSLSDGRRAVDWTGVVVAVCFIGLGWVICTAISDKLVRKGVIYSNWFLIRGFLVRMDVTSDSLIKKICLTVASVAPAGWILYVVYISVTGVIDYWELPMLMAGLTILTQIFILWAEWKEDSPAGNKSHLSKGGNLSKKMSLAAWLILLVIFVYQAGLGDWGVTIFSNDAAIESSLEDEDLIYMGDEGKGQEVAQIAKSVVIEAFSLLGTFLFFASGALLIYLCLLAAMFFFSFNAHYSWQGVGVRWLFYRMVTHGFEALAKVPPYLFLVLIVFWLGFRTYSGCSKQFLWGIALFLSLLPTQMLALNSSIDEAAGSRFLVARRAIGISSWQTFRFLISTHWVRVLPGLLTFALGIVVLMDMSMIWLLDDRGTFTCGTAHWLDILRDRSLSGAESVLVWAFYPAAIYFCVYKMADAKKVATS